VSANAHRRAVKPLRTHPLQVNLQPGDGTTTLPTGGMNISEEVLARFGGGDASNGRRELRALLALSQDRPDVVGPVAKPASVRMAKAADEEAALELYLMDLRANAQHVAPIDEDKCRDLIRGAFVGRGTAIGLIDGPDGKPVGIVILQPVQWYFSQGHFLQEIVLYVHPDHRRGEHAEALMQFSKWFADEISRQCGHRWYLMCGVLGTWRIRAKSVLYARRFTQAGTVFIYPAPTRLGD
jgi:GNAT superfamily N-acetyltransferase